VLLVVAAPLAYATSAPDIASLKYTGWVNDFAHVIDPASKPAIESLCSQLDRKTAAQITVVTISTLGSGSDATPIEDFANKLYRSWGVGRKESKGALLLLVIQDRKSRLEVGYGLEPLLPDGFDGSVLREMRPSLQQQQYGQGALAGVRLLAQRVAEKSNVQLDLSAQPPRRSRSQPSGGGIDLFALLVMFAPILAIVIMIAIFARNRSGGGGGFWMGGGGWSSGGGGWSSGGGSSDSGGGSDFGGFGGGDSGGGGASSDW
jgi:uncharacterized protein